MTGTISTIYRRHSWLQFFTPSLFHMYSQMKKMNFIWLRAGAVQLLITWFKHWISPWTCTAAAAVKSLQSYPTLYDPRDSSPPGSPVPGILQARKLEWAAISFSMHESEKWTGSRSVMSDSSRPHGLQPTRLLRPWDFPGKSTGVGCH